MDSEDDMHDANDVESLDDDFYSGETEDAPMDYYSDYDDDADDYFDDADDSDRMESRRPEVSPPPITLWICLQFIAELEMLPFFTNREKKNSKKNINWRSLLALKCGCKEIKRTKFEALRDFLFIY